MFEPKAESIVLEIVSGFLGISSEEMIRTGDMAKDAIFGPEAVSEEVAAQRLKTVLNSMSKEQALIAGMFISGLMRCNMAQQAQKFMEEMAESGQEPDEDQGKNPE